MSHPRRIVISGYVGFGNVGDEAILTATLRELRAALPDVDGLIIGGGFPEVFMPRLQANGALRESIRSAIEAGLPVYAE